MPNGANSTPPPTTTAKADAIVRTQLSRLAALAAVLAVFVAIPLSACGSVARGHRGVGAGPAATSSRVPGVVSPGAVTVPLSFDAAHNEIPGIDVEIGGARLHVKVDTGSTGLRVNAAKVPAGAVRIIGPARPYAYASGARSTGSLAEATVGIGPLHSAAPTRFELIQAVDCLPDRPQCPLPNGRFDGIIGLSPRAAPDLDNPMWSFGPVGQVFTVHLDPAGGGALILGQPADGFVLTNLAPANVARDDHTNATETTSWRDTTPICFDAAVFAQPVCGPTMFDTGTGALANIHQSEGSDQHPAPGFPITLTTPGRLWMTTYTTADGRSANIDTRSRSAGRPPVSIAGRPVFTGADVRFDLVNGTIGLHTHS